MLKNKINNKKVLSSNKKSKKAPSRTARRQRVIQKNKPKHQVGKGVIINQKDAKKQRETLEPKKIINNSFSPEVKEAVQSRIFLEYLSKNIGRGAVDIVGALESQAQTDDKLAGKLGIKVNEVRRILNLLNNHSITKYDVSKDNKGWLTFNWYIDNEKLLCFTQVLKEKETEEKTFLPDNCNDFFFCEVCFEEQKLVLPFDTAFEANFKCECGKELKILNREEAKKMFA
jgi:transcription initiation factor IIE alpha subunit